MAGPRNPEQRDDVGVLGRVVGLPIAHLLVFDIRFQLAKQLVVCFVRKGRRLEIGRQADMKHIGASSGGRKACGSGEQSDQSRLESFPYQSVGIGLLEGGSGASLKPNPLPIIEAERLAIEPASHARQRLTRY